MRNLLRIADSRPDGPAEPPAGPPLSGTHAEKQLRGEPECVSSADWPPFLAGLPGLAECPERTPEQGQNLDKELPRERRDGGEATGARLPDARRRDQEAQGREEHPDR